jgi:hypothetical protein
MDICRARSPGRVLLVGIALWLALCIPGTAAASSTPEPASPWHHLDPTGAPVVDIWFGWSSTCPHCAKARVWLSDFAPTAPWLQVHSLQVDGADAEANVQRLVDLASTVGEELRGVPIFMFDGRALIGFDETATTGAQLERDLTAYHDRLLATAAAAPTPGGADTGDRGGDEAMIALPFAGVVDARTLSLPLLAVVLGGLDAFNPCALSVLLFLISVLVGARSRRRILIVGGTFVVATGVIYFLLMSAWLNAFLWFGDLLVVTALAGAAALVAGLINVKDYLWLRRGPSLVIPEAARPSIFGRILDLSDAATMPVLLGTTVLVAATTSAYEMLCTGGFPIVFTRVLTLSDLPGAAYYGYLGLYVAVYVLPMVAMVAAFAITLGTRGLSNDEARRLKLLSGLLMVGVGCLLLFAPERLSDLGATVGLFAAAIGLWIAILLVERGQRRRAAA